LGDCENPNYEDLTPEGINNSKVADPYSVAIAIGELEGFRRNWIFGQQEQRDIDSSLIALL